MTYAYVPLSDPVIGAIFANAKLRERQRKVLLKRFLPMTT
jgi:hypothetical protein